MKQLKDFALKVIGMSEEEVQQLYNADGELTEEAFSTLAQRDKDRIKRIREEHKEELTQKFNEGHAKAKKEERSRYEEEIRKQFKVETDAKGVDLIKEVMSQGNKEDVRTHPDYLALEKKLQTEYIPKEDYTVVKGEYESFRAQVERNQVLNRVKEDARKIFHQLNPVLPKDKQRAANQEKEFLRRFESFDYQLQPDGNHVIIKEGKRLENENMNPVLFADLVKESTLSMFDVQEQDARGAAGVEPKGGGQQKKYEDKATFLDQFSNESDPAKRVEMWNAAKAQGLV